MQNNILYRILQSLGLIVISLGLLLGGIMLVSTGVQFWSLVYGLPAVFIGILMSVISFNEINKNRQAQVSDYHTVLCRVCRKSTLAPYLITNVVCSNCQYLIAQKLQLTILIVITVLAIPLTFYLSQQTQTLYQNAREKLPSPYCEVGSWQPSICQCGSWVSHNKCATGNVRICGNLYYCCNSDKSNFTCMILPEVQISPKTLK